PRRPARSRRAGTCARPESSGRSAPRTTTRRTRRQVERRRAREGACASEISREEEAGMGRDVAAELEDDLRVSRQRDRGRVAAPAAAADEREQRPILAEAGEAAPA